MYIVGRVKFLFGTYVLRSLWCALVLSDVCQVWVDANGATGRGRETVLTQESSPGGMTLIQEASVDDEGDTEGLFQVYGFPLRAQEGGTRWEGFGTRFKPERRGEERYILLYSFS